MPRSASATRIAIRNENASVLCDGVNGSAGRTLSVPFSASLNPTAAVTVEIWFRQTAPKNSCLFDNSTSGTTNSYTVYLGVDGGLLWFSTCGGVSRTILTTTAKSRIGEWNFASCTYNGSNILLFLNGAQVGSLAATGALGTNSNALQIGSIHSGAGGFTMMGCLSRPRVYAAACTLAEHQDRYYRNITSPSLQAALRLDLDTTLGAGTAVTDLSGTGNNATMGVGASWTRESPHKARKVINGNLVKNGDFEYAPPFTAVTTVTDRWIDGTNNGSTTNNIFGWKLASTSLSPTVTSISARYTNVSGRNSIQVVSVGAMRKSGATVTALGVFNTAYTGATLLEVDRTNLIPVLPNTTYTLSDDYYTSQIDAGITPVVTAVEYDGTLTRIATNTVNGATDVSVDWRSLTGRFTTAATTRYLAISARMQAGGGVDFDNGNATVAFDNVSLTPVFPEQRLAADGNLVLNPGFEVAPTFVAAGVTQNRWIDGTSGGSTSNSSYKWAMTGNGGTPAVRFDNSVSFNGTSSLKLSTQAVASRLDVTIFPTENAANVALYGISVLPLTTYTASIRVKTNLVSGTATTGARAQLIESDINDNNKVINTIVTGLKTTTDWTLYSVTFTTASTTRKAFPYLTILGNDGAATLIMDAWFDDIDFRKTTATRLPS